jgi:hypothetical protein
LFDLLQPTYAGNYYSLFLLGKLLSDDPFKERAEKIAMEKRTKSLLLPTLDKLYEDILSWDYSNLDAARGMNQERKD